MIYNKNNVLNIKKFKQYDRTLEILPKNLNN